MLDKKHPMKKSFLILCCALASFSLFASEIKTGQDVEVNEKTSENLYLAGGNITINAVVEGDLIAAGGEIYLRDSLLDDVMLGAGELHMDAYCADDFRAIAGEMTISKDVLGDLIVMAGEITIEEGVTIHGSIISAGGEIRINGTVLGDVRMRGGQLELNGKIMGRVDVRGGQIEINNEMGNLVTIAAINIDLGPNALFQSDVSYWAKDGEVDFTDHLAAGVNAHYDTSLKSELADINLEETLKSGIMAWNVFRLISGLFLTLLFFSLFKGFFKRNAGIARNQAGPMILSGVALFFALPLLSAFAFATIVGIPIGIISSAIFIAALTGSSALASVITAFEINKQKEKNWSNSSLLFLSLGLFVALRLIGMVPFFGGFVGLIASGFALGWIISAIRNKRKNQHSGGSSDMV